ncbi:uracil-DNA glycosylase family protein [Arcobacter sp. CECT 8985]|uniref:uracil-DNA glycosylase family protein n=1 Tax=Arcobacter sp. CECT 8985 TaxID=1935424 RepID=UPI00100B5759|nr:uracil-DNA glycosylase family protein [Arcobacter sp. CECT 8985]RXJ87765.1 DNA glycosylase [Arcobacter sp. CECT 8985]
MFNHFHPYEPFLYKECETLIVGTLPPPRFCTKILKKDDVDFCYGSKDNLLWPILENIFHQNFTYDNSNIAIKQRINFLKENKIGICDIVDSCKRDKIDASDLGMKDIKLRDIISVLKSFTKIKKIIFTGKSSKNSPEFFFNKIIKKQNLQLNFIKNKKIREHSLILNNRFIKIYSLTSPSNAANRSIGANKIYKEKKLINPNYSTLDFRIDEYKLAFLSHI